MRSKSLCHVHDFLDIPDLMAHIVKGLNDHADAGIIFVYDKVKHELKPQVSFGYCRFDAKISLVLGEGFPGLCLANAQPFLITSVQKIQRNLLDTLRPRNLRRYLNMREGLPSIQSLISVPLIFRDQPLGVLFLEQFKSNRRRFNRTNLDEIEMIGNWITLMNEYIVLEQRLNNSNRSYRELLGRFLANDEADRKRISREIHDDINHVLLSIKLSLEDMENNLPANMSDIKQKLNTLCSHVSKAFNDLHRLSFELRPPGMDDMGLPQALDWYLATISNEYKISIKLIVNGQVYRKPAPVVETALLRIAQEALSNVVKHARATEANVHLTYTEKDIILQVEDNGIGFDSVAIMNESANTRKLGLLGLEERAKMCGGTLDIISDVPGGTKVTTVIPIRSYDWGRYE